VRSPPALLRYAPLGAFVAVSVLLSLAVHRDGHHWGDDFALYIRQAKSLVEGNTAQVISDNRFSLENSGGWNSFSPYVYPWGVPILLAPFYWQWGLDYEHLKWLGVICFAVFLVAFNRITERRIGYGPALALTAAIGCSLPFLGQTNSVQSEMPFLAFIGLSLWAIDRLSASRSWEGDRLVPLVGVGLLLAFTFNIRREGLAVVAALVATHLAYLASTKRGPGWWRAVRWKRLATPYTTFVVAVLSFQLALPSVLAPRYAGDGLDNLRENVPFYRDELAAHLGFRRPYRADFEVLGSVGLGHTLFRAILWLLAIGILVRLLRYWREDAPLLGYAAATAYATGRFWAHEARYLLQLSPFLLYFAAQALPSLARLVTERRTLASTNAVAGDEPAGPTTANDPATGSAPPPDVAPLIRVAVAIVVAGLAGIALLGFSAARGEAERTDAGNATGLPQDGPTLPMVEEMWAAVRTFTRADDIVAFPRARAMTLHTDRRSIQNGSLDVILRNADYFAMRKNSDYSQPDVSDAEGAQAGMAKIWENDLYVLWRLPE
jgi:hypothetical protein